MSIYIEQIFKNNFIILQVESVGQTTLVVSGLPKRNGFNHAKEIANMSLQYMHSISNFRIVHLPEEKVLLRIGFHSGSCVAGIIYTATVT